MIVSGKKTILLLTFIFKLIIIIIVANRFEFAWKKDNQIYFLDKKLWYFY